MPYNFIYHTISPNTIYRHLTIPWHCMVSEMWHTILYCIPYLPCQTSTPWSNFLMPVFTYGRICTIPYSNCPKTIWPTTLLMVTFWYKYRLPDVRLKKIKILIDLGRFGFVRGPWMLHLQYSSKNKDSCIKLHSACTAI